jgi:hypothetical protein
VSDERPAAALPETAEAPEQVPVSELGRKHGRQRLTTSQRKLVPKVAEYRNHGITSLNGTEARLNADSILTARGKAGTGAPTAVKNLLARL